MAVIQSRWNEETREWQNIADVWALVQEIPVRAGSAIDDYLTENIFLQEEHVRVVLTVFNDFLTEQQLRRVQLSKSIAKQVDLKKYPADVQVMIEDVRLGVEEKPDRRQNVIDAIDKILEHFNDDN